jgi:hypothetical protein
MVDEMGEILHQDVLNQICVVDQQRGSINEVKSDDLAAFAFSIEFTENFRDRLLQTKQIANVTDEKLCLKLSETATRPVAVQKVV